MSMAIPEEEDKNLALHVIDASPAEGEEHECESGVRHTESAHSNQGEEGEPSENETASTPSLSEGLDLSMSKSVVEVYGVRELQEAMARLSNVIMVRGNLGPLLTDAYICISDRSVEELNDLAATLFLPFTGGISLREVRAAVREKLEKMFDKDQQKVIADIGVALVLAVYKGYDAEFQQDTSIVLRLRSVNPELF